MDYRISNVRMRSFFACVYTVRFDVAVRPQKPRGFLRTRGSGGPPRLSLTQLLSSDVYTLWTQVYNYSLSRRTFVACTELFAGEISGRAQSPAHTHAMTRFSRVGLRGRVLSVCATDCKQTTTGIQGFARVYGP